METNFKIITSTEIEYNERLIDLHNNFDFIYKNCIFETKKITLHFIKSNGYWVNNDEYNELFFIFDDYNYLKQIEPENEFIDEDSCLRDITFFDSKLRDENHGIIKQMYPHKDDDIIFSFMSQRIIRVNCKKIVLIPK